MHAHAQVAGAHVLMLGCYVEYGAGSEQFAWLQRDLASVDRARTPWVLVGMHAPWCASLLLPFLERFFETCHAGLLLLCRPFPACMHADGCLPAQQSSAACCAGALCPSSTLPRSLRSPHTR